MARSDAPLPTLPAQKSHKPACFHWDLNLGLPEATRWQPHILSQWDQPVPFPPVYKTQPDGQGYFLVNQCVFVHLSASLSMLLVLQDPSALTGWTTETLDNGCFTFGSDVYQIGDMLIELLERSNQPVPSAAADLVHVLESKVSANAALSIHGCTVESVMLSQCQYL
ncbi:hypothetical protein ABBQ32_003225 [Trebouxia sp. C0010 RCD-2024]